MVRDGTLLGSATALRLPAIFPFRTSSKRCTNKAYDFEVKPEVYLGQFWKPRRELTHLSRRSPARTEPPGMLAAGAADYHRGDPPAAIPEFTARRRGRRSSWVWQCCRRGSTRHELAGSHRPRRLREYAEQNSARMDERKRCRYRAANSSGTSRIVAAGELCSIEPSLRCVEAGPARLGRGGFGLSARQLSARLPWWDTHRPRRVVAFDGEVPLAVGIAMNQVVDDAGRWCPCCSAWSTPIRRYAAGARPLFHNHTKVENRNICASRTQQACSNWCR